MIVREAGESWQIVLQTDHADFAAQIVDALAERPERLASVRIAAARHDDGWAVWERAPGLDPDGRRPRNFLDVEVPLHLAFYRACIAAVGEQDPYAGLLVSMHGAGIYRRRYGLDPELKLTFAREVSDQVDAFVLEQVQSHPARIEQLGIPDPQRWSDYELLQLVDRLSLHFCMRDVERDGAELQGHRLAPAGPWRVTMAPYPFGEGPARFSLLRRVLPKRAWPGEDEFREELFALEPERVEIMIERGEEH